MALYETGALFRQEFVDGLPKAHPTLSGLWPIGKMPLLHDAARDQAVPESTIIIEYLQRYYPGTAALIPEETASQIETRLWDRFFDLYVHTPMGKHVIDRLRPDDGKDPAGVAEAKALLDTAYAMLEKRLATRDWVAGDAFTLADCAAMPALFYAQAVHPFSPSHPALAGLSGPADRSPFRAADDPRGAALPPFLPVPRRLDARFTSPDF